MTGTRQTQALRQDEQICRCTRRQTPGLTADLVRQIGEHSAQSEADTRPAVTLSGTGPAVSLLDGRRGGARGGGRLGKGIPGGRSARVAESLRSLHRRPSPTPPPLPGRKRVCDSSLPPGRIDRKWDAAGSWTKPTLGPWSRLSTR